MRAGGRRLRRTLIRVRGFGDAEKRLVWMLGSPRSGSTWPLNLLGHSEPVIKVDEPAIGAHLGLPVSDMVLEQPLDVPRDGILLA